MAGNDIVPLGNRIAVQWVDEGGIWKHSSGLYLPENPYDTARRAKVVFAGKGHYSGKGVFIPTELKVGDIVLIGKYTGTAFTVNDQEYIICKDSDVLAIVSPDAEIRGWER